MMKNLGFELDSPGSESWLPLTRYMSKGPLPLCLNTLLLKMKTKVSSNLTKWLEGFKDEGSEHNAGHRPGFRDIIYLYTQGAPADWGKYREGQQRSIQKQYQNEKSTSKGHC